MRGVLTEFLVMWYKMSVSGVATMGLQYGSTATSHGADDPPGERLGDQMPHPNNIYLQLLNTVGRGFQPSNCPIASET